MATVLATVLALAGSAHASIRIDHQARLYLLESHSTEKTLSCSATLLKLEGRCRLLTNAHCLADGEKTESVRIRLSEGHSIAVPVLRADPGLDVAELGLGDEHAGLDRQCRSLESIRGTILTALDQGLQSERLAGFGFFNGVPNTEVASSSFKRVPIASPRSGALLLRASDLDTLPGMSGGLLTAFPSRPVALLAHLIPLQKTSFAIPLEVIQDWLAASQASASSDAGAIPMPARAWTANVAVPRAGNSHSDGGKNSHSDGGKNSHSDGGGLDLRLRHDRFALFSEPDEGVPLPGAPETILLGIGPNQIDGWDDYFQFSSRPGSLVTRSRGGFPEATVRAGLLVRLSGIFRSPDDFYSRTSRRIVAQDLSRPDGWSPRLEGRLEARLDVDATSRELQLELRAHELRQNFSSFAADRTEPTRILRYQALFSDENRVLELRDLATKERLRCENRHYRKLICRGASTGFSLSSQESEGGTRVQLRHWRIDDASATVDYVFGELFRLQERP